MNHPNREQWVPFLFGEADPDTRRDLSNHLRKCPHCATELNRWRHSLKRLHAWRAPAAPSRLIAGPVLLRWAAAALLILGLGFAIGRWSAPLSAQAQRDLLRAAAAQTDQALQRLADLSQAERAEDQRALRAAFETTQQQHAADFVALRKDLETVATRTDEEIRRSRRQFIELTSTLPTNNDQQP